MVTSTTDDRPDVHEMVVIHRIFRQGFTELADLARRVPTHDRGWASAVAEESEFLLGGLHHHHSAEDAHLWPLLVERSQPDAELVARMAAQHEAVAAAVAHCRSVLPSWRESPGGPLLADALDDVNAVLAPHLEEEEARILPLCRRCITQSEWQTMGDAAFAGFTNEEKFLALGWMVSTATPAEAEAFLGRLPWVVRAMWSVVGRRRFARRMARLRGGAQGARGRGVDSRARRPWTRMGNRLGVWIYRRTDGRLASGSRDVRVAMITTPGRRTGQPRSTCVRFLQHGDDLLVWGSGSGSPRDPDWFENLRRADVAEVQVRAQRFRAAPRELVGEERDRAWQDIVLVQAPQVAKYAARAGRTIPVARLTPLDRPVSGG